MALRQAAPDAGVLTIVVPFATYPRRVVALPGGAHALVLIRRNVGPRFNLWNSADMGWEFAHLARLLRRDRRWRVELHREVDSDPGQTPREEPNQVWVLPDHATAATFAEALARTLGAGGTLPSN